MSEVVGVRLQRAGRVYYFDPMRESLEVNDPVVVETEEGPQVGWVVVAPQQMIYSELPGPLRPVLRKATPEDLASQASL